MKSVCIVIVCFLSANFLSAQCIQGNCNNGKGTYVYKSGAKYVGQFYKGKIANYGTLYFSDGKIYQGQWKNQRRHGKGKMKYANGEIYTGAFVNNVREGLGKMEFSDGTTYEGEWKNDVQEGNGFFEDQNGNKRMGQWVAGEETNSPNWNTSNEPQQEALPSEIKDCNNSYCSSETGKYTYKDGSYFVGSFVNGVPEGEGICYYKNGDRYEGGWKNNAPHGKGVMYFSSGKAYGAMWNAGYPIKTIDAQQQPRKELAQVSESSPEVKIWAVIVGIASYNHMPTLKYTDDDAYQIYAFLKSPEGGALPDERISLLIDEAATREQILAKMESTFAKADENDVVMLYYSGHGLPGSFLPIDYDGYNNTIAHHEVKAILDNSKAKHKICFADACHSGSLLAMKSPFNAKRMKSFLNEFENASAGTALFTSSKSEEISMETTGLRQGIYSHFLIKGLKGEADRDRNKIVTISELHDYVSQHVKSYTMNRQNPVIAGNYDHNMPVSIVIPF